MWGCALNPSFASLPARSTMRANPAVVNGAPRSDVNMNGDLGSCSRWSRRRARRMRAGCALLDPADVQGGRFEVHLIPAARRDLVDPTIAAHAGRIVKLMAGASSLERPANAKRDD
jgi:hypothetical protein